ncbi:NADPH dehydrogenase NamA [Paenibacillus thalictri]|uniref:NADPH dehydrogenase NamA n=1 Tax=Paenibacillus thalictri TaxID=2527873 RepID=A0A4Q9DTS2_9BACL|nr:NADPH dehydrogenase NamA [Paenibacillus thalictri]TBL80353.1 NADPH dehydrogenase NamA [Paenibacillus thalictri]
MAQLFAPLTIRNVTLHNRIVMSPMCMYSCPDKDGTVNDWHKTHYTTRAVGQVGLIIVEASAVTPQGRISEQDLGIWSDEHIPGLTELVRLVHGQGAKIGIQIAHAGRKSTVSGPIVAPSAIAFDSKYKLPEEMTLEQIHETIGAFIAAAKRAAAAGFDVIEIHAAHGYLINQFLSPLANKRTDEYGGDAERRYRFLKEVLDGVRAVWEGPLFVRVSANEYHPEGNDIRQYVQYAEYMKQQGADLIDCSSGSVVPYPINIYPGYQIPLSEAIRSGAGLLTGAVGLITEPAHAEEVIAGGRADLVFLARELLRDPYWPRRAAKELKHELKPPKQYERGWL